MIIRIKFLLVILFLGFAPVHPQQVETVVQSGHYDMVTAVCYSPDGSLVFTGSNDKTVILWRRSDGRQMRSYQGAPSGISFVTVDKPMRYLLGITDNGYLMVWELNSGKLLRKSRPEKDRYTCAAFSPDGMRLATGTEKSGIMILDVSTWEKTGSAKVIPGQTYFDKDFEYPESKSVRWSTDGKYLLAGVSDNTAIIFDGTAYTEIRKYKKINSSCSGCLTEAVITSDNKLVITASSDTLKVFDRESGRLVKRLFGKGGSPESLTISPDNRYVGAIEYGTAEIWDLSTGKLVNESGDYSENQVKSIAISPDGKEYLAGTEKRFSDIIRIDPGKTMLSLRGYLNQTDEKILKDQYMYWAGMVNVTRLSPDGRLIAVGRSGNNARLIDFATGKVFRTLRGHKAMVLSLCFSPDGKYLATGGIDGRAIVCEV
ncbi:MAG: WD40 repeat domain-containing protein, partial [Bacteroidales bacterium]